MIFFMENERKMIKLFIVEKQMNGKMLWSLRVLAWVLGEGLLNGPFYILLALISNIITIPLKIVVPRKLLASGPKS